MAKSTRSQPKPRRYTVSLPFFPRVAVTASDEQEAVASYRGYFGILDSDHAFLVDTRGARSCPSLDDLPAHPTA